MLLWPRLLPSRPTVFGVVDAVRIQLKNIFKDTYPRDLPPRLLFNGGNPPPARVGGWVGSPETLVPLLPDRRGGGEPRTPLGLAKGFCLFEKCLLFPPF